MQIFASLDTNYMSMDSFQCTLSECVASLCGRTDHQLIRSDLDTTVLKGRVATPGVHHRESLESWFQSFCESQSLVCHGSGHMQDVHAIEFPPGNSLESKLSNLALTSDALLQTCFFNQMTCQPRTCKPESRWQMHAAKVCICSLQDWLTIGNLKS